MKKSFQICFVVIVSVFLVGLAVLTLFFPQTNAGEYDVWENRRLAEKPVLNIHTVFDGSFFSSAETYLSDHFYGREKLLTANVRYRQLRGCPSVNGVVETDGVLLLDNGIYDRFGAEYKSAAAEMAERLSAVRDVTEENGGIFLYIGVPTQRNVFADAYPAYMNNDLERTEEIKACLLSALSEKDIDVLMMLEDALSLPAASRVSLYSPVDHHFTLKGAAFCVRQALAHLNEIGAQVPVAAEENLSFDVLLNPMLGTYNRKLYGCTDTADSLLVYTLPQEVPYERWDNGVQTDAPLIILPQTETEYVQYTAYMGGDIAETIVKTNRPELKKLLVVGDSFTNAMETILYLSFDEMRSLDFRYYKDKTLSEYIAEYLPDVVLYIRDASVFLNLEGNGNIQ